MKTTFVLRLRHPDAAFARSMARMCFDLLDDIEGCLSRYCPDSDVSRINLLRAGESLLIHPHTHGCLLRAIEAHGATGGLFDVTLGRQIMHRKSGKTSPPPPLTGGFRIDPVRPRIECIEPGRELDLGGIGKGHALDILSAHLAELAPPDALLSAGTSTHLAIGPTTWPVSLNDDDADTAAPHPLRNGALSTSGLAVQGMHLCHPEHPDADTPAFTRVRIAHSSAALADAFSTACLLMTPAELAAFLRSRPDTTLLQVLSHGRPTNRPLTALFHPKGCPCCKIT